MIPYDRNRVILTPDGARPHSTYINASFIEGYFNDESFIITQDPLQVGFRFYISCIAIVVMVTLSVCPPSQSIYGIKVTHFGNRKLFQSGKPTHHPTLTSSLHSTSSKLLTINLCIAGDRPGLLADGGGAQRDDHGETLRPGVSVLAVLAS